MSSVRFVPALCVVLLGTLAFSAAPSPEQITQWAAALTSDDPAVSRPAMEHLWKAGKRAEPALRAAMKHADPDVKLRARVVLARFEWGIFSDTPPRIVQAIERFRDGTRPDQTAAIESLFKEGKNGFHTIRHLLSKETDPAWQQQILTKLQGQYRTLLRDLIRARDHTTASELLETIAATQNDQAVRDLAAFWLLTGRISDKVRELDQKARSGDRFSAVLATYLHRANGDLASARGMAEKASNPELLSRIQDEQEDHVTLARNPSDYLRNDPAKLALLLHRAGDVAGSEKALRQLYQSTSNSRSDILFFTGRPFWAIAAERKSGNVASACELLALQGRRREALAIDPELESKDNDQRLWVRLRQATILHDLGESEEAYRRLLGVLKSIEKNPITHGYLLGEIFDAAFHMSRRNEIFQEFGKIIDALKSTIPTNIPGKISKKHQDAVALWWDHFRGTAPATPPSTTLARLRGWFEEGKPDSDFDKTIEAVAKVQGRPPAVQDRWNAALVSTFLAVGKPDRAEQLLVSLAKSTPNKNTCLRLGDFYLERKRWKEAAAQYSRASDADPTAPLPMLLQGIALAREDKTRGEKLIETAQLLIGADEEGRYTMYRELDQRGLTAEADAQRLLLVRTAGFGSIYTTNGLSGLAYSARRDRPLDAARYYRRIYMNLGMSSSGAFTDSTAYLWVPAQAHLYEARGLLAAGKYDSAIEEIRRYLVCMPEGSEAIIESVRTLDRAGRKADADTLFESGFARLHRICSDSPKAADLHNRLAWLAARCGRQLDIGLRYARLATARKPDTAGYLDTLAEVYFQRGDRDEAISTMQRAVKLAPKVAYYAAQLKRIEAGDRTAELPAQ